MDASFILNSYAWEPFPVVADIQDGWQHGKVEALPKFKGEGGWGE